MPGDSRRAPGADHSQPARSAPGADHPQPARPWFRTRPTLGFGNYALSGRGNTVAIILVSVLCTAVTMYWNYRIKAFCGGPPFSEGGRSMFQMGDNVPRSLIPCYSDILTLWFRRGLGENAVPYFNGGITDGGTLYGGVVEYPVLSGMMMYLAALGTENDTEFLRNTALMIAPFGLIIAALLASMVRWWALLWAATPPLVLYSFHNWELPVVATAVIALAIVVWGESQDPTTGRSRLPLPTTASLAAIVLGIGFCLKIYPGIFALPLAAYVLTRGVRGLQGRGLDWRGAGLTAGAAAGTVIAIQLPFMVFGYEGWRAALSFQSQRQAELDTNSIWYWGLRHLTGGQNDTYHALVDVLSPLLVLIAFGVSMWLGSKHFQRYGVFPWIGVSASMLAGFMLFHKVHSPQYTLWILPFFVLLKVRWPVIVAYLVADVMLDLSIFRLFDIYSADKPMQWWILTSVVLAVWIHIVLLAWLIVKFVSAEVREPLATRLRLAAARAPAIRADDPATR